MESDLGLTGLGIVVALALAFGVIAHFVVRTGAPRIDWLIAAIAWVAGALFVSEVLFPGVTERDLQPVIDGLAFDEALFGGLAAGLVAVVAVRLMAPPARRATTA